MSPKLFRPDEITDDAIDNDDDDVGVVASVVTVVDLPFIVSLLRIGSVLFLFRPSKLSNMGKSSPKFR